MNFDDLSPELKKKARACKTPEEILAVAKEEGIELSDDSSRTLLVVLSGRPQILAHAIRTTGIRSSTK